VVVKCQKEPHTSVEENSRSRIKYKLFLGFLKIIPMLMAGLFLLNTVLSYFGIDYSIISYLAGVGLIPWLFILAASYTLSFCGYHRMFLWYILVNNIVCLIDDNYGLPVSDRGYLVLHFIIAGIFLFLVLYFHQRCRKKS
jgi:ABC-type polysaccharide/polyol phosphate export permease